MEMCIFSYQILRSSRKIFYIFQASFFATLLNFSFENSYDEKK